MIFCRKQVGLFTLGLLVFFCGYSQNEKPEKYISYKAIEELKIDGDLTEESWKKAPWTADFVDIEGDKKPTPSQRTRVKMLWDSSYFYVGAEICETDIWATYDEKDMVIFHENDFEIFIDPNGDRHNYYELEINALGTLWDLMLTKPYRDRGTPINSWEIKGLKSAVKINGTLNDPTNKDDKWFVEWAIPWKVLMETFKNKYLPVEGEQWRVNFSRVNWRIENKNGKYIKQIDPKTNKPYSEYNWVWSPQGVIAMHLPEKWGYVQFSSKKVGESVDEFIALQCVEGNDVLKEIYYLQFDYYKENGKYLVEKQLINALTKELRDVVKKYGIVITVGESFYNAEYICGGNIVSINNEGRIVRIPKP